MPVPQRMQGRTDAGQTVVGTRIIGCCCSTPTRVTEVRWPLLVATGSPAARPELTLSRGAKAALRIDAPG